MPQTVPNQRIVKIHREKAEKDFLGIKNENWMAASRDLGAHALRLYLYFAANKDGFDLALSQAAATNAIGIPRSTYHDQFHVLLNKGYIVPVQGNIYAFYEKPQPSTATDEKNIIPERGFDFENISSDSQTSPAEKTEFPQGGIEINNKYNYTDNVVINNGEEISKPIVKEKTYNQMTKAEEEASKLFDAKMKDFKF